MTREGVENLVSAIINRAVLDYESVISGSVYIPSTVTVEELEIFAKNQTYADIDLLKVFKSINRTYFDEFIPLVNENNEEIRKDYKKIKKESGNNTTKMRQLAKYHCPLCGGILKPTGNIIGCTYCNLSVYAPKPRRKKKCQNH